MKKMASRRNNPGRVSSLTRDPCSILKVPESFVKQLHRITEPFRFFHLENTIMRPHFVQTDLHEERIVFIK